MSCTHPIYALRLGVKNPDTGKEKIKILPKRPDIYNLKVLEDRYGKGNILSLPCGKCLDCRLSYAREWALRCVCESLYHDDNFFITLTYDPKFYPGDLVKKDLQDFIKRVRKYKSFRYFACGEHGHNGTERAHYHLIAFGLKLDDLKCIGRGRKGGYYYESKFLKKMWPKGFIVIGDCNYTTCNYVSRYVLKKLDDHHKTDFVCMSTHPGIGSQYFYDHIESIKSSDLIYVNNNHRYYSTLPRYFDKLLDKLSPEDLERLKTSRLNRANDLMQDKLITFNREYVEDLNLNVLNVASINKLKSLKKGR